MTEMYLKEELSSVASTKCHVFEKKNKQMVTVDQALRKPVCLSDCLCSSITPLFEIIFNCGIFGSRHLEKSR